MAGMRTWVDALAASGLARIDDGRFRLRHWHAPRRAGASIVVIGALATEGLGPSPDETPSAETPPAPHDPYCPRCARSLATVRALREEALQRSEEFERDLAIAIGECNRERKRIASLEAKLAERDAYVALLQMHLKAHQKRVPPDPSAQPKAS